MKKQEIKCRIADLNVLVRTDNEQLISQTAKYQSDFEKEDIVADVDREAIERLREKEGKVEPLSVYEYLYNGAVFYCQLVKFNGFMLHSSALKYKDKAYLFSAPPGTGKSTHVGLWREAFGEEVEIINDDKPAIRIVDDVVYAYGTPWSGKNDLSANIKAPIGAIVLLTRGEKNTMRYAETAEAVRLLLWQSVRPFKEKNMQALLNLVEKVIEAVPVYVMECLPNIEAAEMAERVLARGEKI